MSTLRLPVDPSTPQPQRTRAARARHTGTADLLFDRMLRRGEPFWAAVYPLFIRHDITREELRQIVTRGLEQSSGRYKTVLELFNMSPTDYRRFLNFLRKHQCLVPFQPFRPSPSAGRAKVSRPSHEAT